ncbi:NAD(P)-dependent oxidoreductase [Nocardia sp. KC 131]|uniref:NAD(P)-dependent oxidoreductase n=1 Tax=Nocardia arseniciresistens TaxID=3392119 RepID=UPI00398EC525
MRVGFIGLGSQGAPMAQRIVAAGYRTTLWARRPESLAPFADTTARVAESPTELARASDLVCLCVGNDADVRAVLTGEHGVLAGTSAGGIIAVHSTIHPDTCRDLADIAGAQNVSLIDAAVSGGALAAAEGRLLVMAGGPADILRRCRPVFETYANPIVHLGDTGSGHVTKLLNNLLFTANLATAASVLTLGQQLGVEPARLGEVISHGSANSFALDRLLTGSLESIATTAGHTLRKDIQLVADLATAAEATTGIALSAADATLALMGHQR